MNVPAVITLPLSLMENMRMELAWRFTDLFDQFWSFWNFPEEVKSALKDGKSITECKLPNIIDNSQ